MSGSADQHRATLTTGPRPVCFMVMPFGTKPTPVSLGAPRNVDFDALWLRAIKPAIDSLGYQAVRADQDLGALIVVEMLERLTVADLVVADLTIPNGNAYYEVGVRHAAKEAGCVLIAAEWAKPLFDLDQMRQVRYPLSSQTVSPPEAAEIRSRLANGIPALASSQSPLFTLPGYPDVEPERTQAFRRFVAELSEFQAAIAAVRGAAGVERAARAEILIEHTLEAHVGPLLPAIALELVDLAQDELGWAATLSVIDRLPIQVREHPRIRELRCLALAEIGDAPAAIGALEQLIQLYGDSPERRGLLGGRYKRLYDAAGSENDRRRYLNKAIENYERGMMLDLNAYYSACNLPRLLRERDRPDDRDRSIAVAHVVVLACERARSLSVNDEWLNPTLLGAAFDARDVDKARHLAQMVVDEGATNWKLASTLNDLRRSTDQVAEQPLRDELGAIATELAEIIEE